MMRLPMKNSNIQENSFEGGVAGTSGISNYGQSYGTPGGGNTVQDPNHFASSETPSSGSNPPARPDRQSSSGALISPAALADKQKADKPLAPDQQFEPQVNRLFKKNITPSPDEILQGLQYELGNMIQKDKVVAKQTVLKNLKQDPTYYSRLGMLNIDDKNMKVDEAKQSTFTKTKNLLEQMIAAKKKSVMAPPPNTDEIMKGLWEKRHGYKGK